MSTSFPGTPSMGGRTPTVNGIMAISVVALAVSLAATFYYLFTEGHAAFNTHSYGITWGLGIATYVYLVLVSTGLTFVASLAMLFRLNGFYPIAKRCVWLAIITLVAGFTTLALEIGHPIRMLWAMPLGLQYASPMFWMGVFYTLYLVFLAWKFQRVHEGDWSSRLSRNLGIASFVSVIVAHGNLGLVFGMMSSRPVWQDYMLPVYFLVTAGLSGTAFAFFFTYLTYDFDRGKMPEALRSLVSGTTLPNVFASLIAITIFMVASRTISGLWSNLDGLQVYAQVVRSPLYHVELWLGLVVPFILMLHPTLKRMAGAQITAAALVVVAVFIGRYEFIINGQIVPVFKGTWVPGLIEYAPSLAEWMITLVGFSLVFVLYTLGARLLNLADSPAAVRTEEVMHRAVRLTDPDMRIAEAAKEMRDLNIGCLPVLEGNELIGIITDRDIACRAVAEVGDSANLTVRDVMTKEVVFCFEDQEVGDAARIMQERKVRRLPILDRDNHLVGMLTLSDLSLNVPELTGGIVRSMVPHH